MKIENMSNERLATEAACPLDHVPLRLLQTSVYRGPHLFSALPMVRLQVDLGVLESWPTDRLPGFADRLAEMLPDLAGHGCSYQAPGGFLKRMEEGTWIGHV